MKIAYIGLDLFYTALETLEDLGCEIVEIFTCKTDNVTEFNLKITEFAKVRGIPCQLSRITSADIDRLLGKGCKMAVCGGYYYKIPADTKLPIVNIHPSLLPIGRGSWPMAMSILRGDKKSGVTIHKIAEGFDAGDILLQREFALDERDTHKSFMDKANGLLPEMLAALVGNFDSLYASAMPQNDGEYWDMPTEDMYTVTSDMTVEEADLIFRAFYGYECIYKNNGETTVLIGARAVKGSSVDAQYLLKDGYVAVNQVKSL